jgi:hypothetical protein
MVGSGGRVENMVLGRYLDGNWMDIGARMVNS